MATQQFRFRVSLKNFIVLVLFCGLGVGFWISWPVQTARSLFLAIEEKNVEQVERLVGIEHGGIEELLDHKYSHASLPVMKLSLRSFNDVVSGRQEFTFGKTYFGVAERGRIVLLTRRYGN